MRFHRKVPERFENTCPWAHTEQSPKFRSNSWRTGTGTGKHQRPKLKTDWGRVFFFIYSFILCFISFQKEFKGFSFFPRETGVEANRKMPGSQLMTWQSPEAEPTPNLPSMLTVSCGVMLCVAVPGAKYFLDVHRDQGLGERSWM